MAIRFDTETDRLLPIAVSIGGELSIFRLAIYSRGHSAGALRMRAGAAIIPSAALSGVRTSLAAIFLSSGSRTGAVGVGTFILGNFGHNCAPHVI